jgi:hypothetical protein
MHKNNKESAKGNYVTTSIHNLEHLLSFQLSMNLLFVHIESKMQFMQPIKN